MYKIQEAEMLANNMQRRYRRTEEKTDRIRSRRCWNCTGLPAVKMAA